MKETIFMRVLFCKIHCPYICFCKPTAAHLYTSRPFKLENTPSTAYAVSDEVSDKLSSSEVVNGKHEAESVLKSCIKKLPPRLDAANEVEKKRVQWTDSLGKELAEIKEFEPSETGDTDNEEESSRCLCVIL